jgi:hypothetical protein
LSCAIAVTLAAAKTAATSIEMNCFILIPFSRVVWEKPAMTGPPHVTRLDAAG